METKDYIDRIEALRTDLYAIRAKHGIETITFLAGKYLGEVPIPKFVELCDHYGVKPTDSMFPSGWIRHDGVSICFDCVRVDAARPKPSDTLDRLRSLVANTPAQ